MVLKRVLRNLPEPQSQIPGSESSPKRAYTEVIPFKVYFTLENVHSVHWIAALN